jgi:DNA-binding LacI/PurR family transcriptional regulator
MDSLPPPPLAATAHDVARLAGVSQSAVSRAFTEGASISAAMRRKVIEAAEALNYRPNLLARSLITGRSKIVGVSMGNLENNFFPLVLDALSIRLSQAGLRLLLFTAQLNAEVDGQIEDVLHYRVDALVLLSTSMSSNLANQCRDAGIPVVLINRTVPDSDAMCSVTGENARGAQEIGRFLLENGYRSLAFMAGFVQSSTSHERERAFTDYLLSQGLPPPIREVGHFTHEGAVAAARRLLSRPDRPDAIFCGNDHMAFATIDVARYEFGLEIGRDVAIVGFDDVPMAAWPSFSLTTFSQPIVAMVERAVDLILRFGDVPESERRAVVPGALIVRDSARRRP